MKTMVIACLTALGIVAIAGCYDARPKPDISAPFDSDDVVMFNDLFLEEITVPGVRFGSPTPRHPYYHLVVVLPDTSVHPCKPVEVKVNGMEVRDWVVYNVVAGKFVESNKKSIAGDADVKIVVRADWVPDTDYEVRVTGTHGKEKPTTYTFSAKGNSTGKGPGYWNTDWKYYASVVLTENAGADRTYEPVHVTLPIFSDRLTDPAAEFRVIAWESDRYREIPSQVYGVSAWKVPADIKGKLLKDRAGKKWSRYHDTTMVSVAFLADVKAKREKVYLIFYGNPKAKAPNYKTDLKISGKGLARVIENEHYKIGLAKQSGQLETVLVKAGLDILLEHKLETNGAIHWNPGTYAPPQPWVHASDWDNPKVEEVSGPIFFMTRRRAPLPHMEGSDVTVTYLFYAHNPYVMTTTLQETTRDLRVKAFRNGEIVFNHAVLDEFVYKNKRGEIGRLDLNSSKRHPTQAMRISADPPWLAFINRKKKIGFAGIGLEYVNVNRNGGFASAVQPYIYVNNGPWIYWSRGIAYSFGSNNQTLMYEVKSGGLYHEKNAYMPFRLGDKSGREFDVLDRYETRLTSPLEIRHVEDTDPRTPKGWIEPILVEHFDEGVAGSVGGAGEED